MSSLGKQEFASVIHPTDKWGPAKKKFRAQKDWTKTNHQELQIIVQKVGGNQVQLEKSLLSFFELRP